MVLKQAPKQVAQFGVQMFTLRQYTQTVDDLRFAIGRIRELGYQAIETAGFGDIDAAVVAEICQSSEITITGTHTPWDRFKFDLDRVIEEHKMWQCKYAGVGMIPPKTYLSMAGLDHFLTELRPIAERLAGQGIRFVYHNHNHEFRHFDGKPWLAHLYDNTTNDEVMAEFDTHWIVAGGADPVAWIDRYGDRIAALHLKDFALNTDGQRIFAPVGKGNLNWPAILEAARRHDVARFYVEQDDCYGVDEFECLDQSLTFLSSQSFS